MRKKSITPENITPQVVLTSPWRLSKVKALRGYQLEVEFLDGIHGFVDMSSLVSSKHAGVFSALKNQQLFDQVFLEFGVATWPGQIDLAPDAMYEEIKKNSRWIVV